MTMANIIIFQSIEHPSTETRCINTFVEKYSAQCKREFFLDLLIRLLQDSD